MNTLIAIIQASISKGVAILFGATGEILYEKSGSLNLGIPGIMYMGGIGGVTGAFLYENAAKTPNGWLGVLFALLGCLLFSVVAGLIFSVLTITLRANQNVTGLALTTFGVGFSNYLGGSLAKLVGSVGSVTIRETGTAFKTRIPGLSGLPVVGELLFSYGFLTYLAIALAIFLTWILVKTRVGLSLSAVGENPGAADAAGIPVERYRYVSNLCGAVIAGLGGTFYVMEYFGGTWQNGGFDDLGWLAIALVIFATWKPTRAILGSVIFGVCFILCNYLGLNTAHKELFKMVPYVITILVLVFTSMRSRKENQPPEGLGIPYFREER